jgi:hypothetical protein
MTSSTTKFTHRTLTLLLVTTLASLGICTDTCDGEGMYLDGNNECQLCPEYDGNLGSSLCKICSLENGCDSCFDGFTVYEGLCVSDLVFQTPPVGPFDLFGKQVQNCPEEYFYPVEGVCKKKPCLCTRELNNICIQCAGDFVAIDGDCIFRATAIAMLEESEDDMPDRP